MTPRATFHPADNPTADGARPWKPHAGEAAQEKQGTVGIIDGFRGTRHYAAAGLPGPVFFPRKPGFSIDSRARMVKGIGRRTSAVDPPRTGGPVTPVVPRLRASFRDPSMAKAERTFLLPCACGARLPVTAGQAGGRTVCAACGCESDVPRLRDLSAHAVDEVCPTPASGASLARGLLVAGVAIAIAAAAMAAALVPIGGLFFRQPPTAADIRASVAAAPLTDVHAAWQSMARYGVVRPASMEELRLQQFATRAVGISRLLWGTSAVGLAAAVAGAALAAAGGGRRR